MPHSTLFRLSTKRETVLVINTPGTEDTPFHATGRVVAEQMAHEDVHPVEGRAALRAIVFAEVGCGGSHCITAGHFAGERAAAD